MRGLGIPMPTPTPRYLSLGSYQDALRWIASIEGRRANMRAVEVCQIWALAGLASMARHDQDVRLDLELDLFLPSSRFAHSVGFDAVVAGEMHFRPAEEDRTVPLQRVTGTNAIDSVASRIARLISRDDEESRDTITYVLVELLRNALQHSRDQLGAVVGAQLMDQGFHGYEEQPLVQVAVADCGMGIEESLRATQSSLKDAVDALTDQE